MQHYRLIITRTHPAPESRPGRRPPFIHFHILAFFKMKNFASTVVFWLFVVGLGSGPAAAQQLGADLTYKSLGNNLYRVKLRLYQDCASPPAGAFALECRLGGCGTGSTITVPLVPQGAVVQPTPLCAGAAGTCQNPSSQYPLFNFATSEATVALPPGQWTLSASPGNRPDFGNLLNAGAGDLYAEAYLDNSGLNGANTTPQFEAEDIPVQYVCANQNTTFGFSALEADGDSVVYSMAAPLNGCNTAMAYRPYPFIGCLYVLHRVPLCVVDVPGWASFSPGLPLRVGIDTLGSCPVMQGVPSFYFNQNARTVRFRPVGFVPNLPVGIGTNRYLLAVQADEYRRVQGVRRLVGRIRHEVVFIVADCGSNAVPAPVTATAQTAGAYIRTVNTADTTEISVYTCQLSQVRLDFTDPNNLRTPSAHQPLTVTLPADLNTNPLLLDAGAVGSFVLSGNGTEHPVGTFFFQPAPGTAGRTIRVSVRVEDNACPVKARQNRVIVIRVLRGTFATITAVNPVAGGAGPAVYPGDTLELQGKAMRPDSIRRLASATTTAQLYSYQWTVPGDGLPPGAAGRATIRLVPTTTSRYLLRVAALSGFAQGACADTTSVLVRLLPAPVPPPTISQAGTVLTSSAATGNQWYLNGQPIAGATGPSITAAAGGTYTVRVTVVVGARTYTTPPSAPLAVPLAARPAPPGTSLEIIPNPTPDGYVRVLLTGYAGPVTITVLDALGRSVAHATAAGAQNPSVKALDLSSLPAGLYLLQVRAGSSLVTRRLVRE